MFKITAYQQSANTGSWISTIVMFAVILFIIFLLVRKFYKKEPDTKKEYKRSSGLAKGWLFATGIFFCLAFIHAIRGYSKLMNMNDAKAYVGGDAYNYIIHSINSNSYVLFAIFYAILAGVSMLCANFVRMKAVSEHIKN